MQTIKTDPERRKYERARAGLIAENAAWTRDER